MDKQNNNPEIFKYGSTWLRTDFHLHTKADKEFKYEGEENNFINNYVSELKAKGIRVGAITNHNKFDTDEFKALRKKSRKEDIFLLPGVELSVNDGANGIHTLVVFSDEWIAAGQNYINQFLNVAFEGKTPNQYEQENGRTSLDLLNTLKKLESYHRDFFIVFAHVEQNSGLWNEFAGGRLQEIGQDKVFRRRTLGFQKARTRDDRDKIKQWLNSWYPAEVEGSDCKSISDIGNGKKSYLKIGAFSFDAVKFALIDKNNRVSKNTIEYKHSHIRNIRFTGGTLAEQEIHFSPELNTLIGIRGSGKSSVLEVLRYVLEIPFGEKSGDRKYKENLVAFTMGSGGKVGIDAVNRFGQTYTIRRVSKEQYSDVLVDGKLQPGISIRETVLRKPIYFGQKDLSSTGEGFEKDLVDKLLGSKLNDIRRKISAQKNKVIKATELLLKISDAQEQLEEQNKIKQDTEFKLEFYKKHGVEEKLQKRLDFDKDGRKMEKGVSLINNFVSDLESLLAQYEDDIRNFKGYKSKYNAKLFKKFYFHYEKYVEFIEQVKDWLKTQTNEKKELLTCKNELSSIRKSMVEEFAEIERKLSKELKEGGTQNINSDDFFKLKEKLDLAVRIIAELEKQDKQKNTLHNSLLEELGKLNEFWLEEFNCIKAELDKIGTKESSLSITSGFKEDKQAFLNFMKDMFRGSGIRGTTYQKLVDKYSSW